jgi:hypothetical protein
MRNKCVARTDLLAGSSVHSARTICETTLVLEKAVLA